jgi:hypothetical protein
MSSVIIPIWAVAAPTCVATADNTFVRGVSAYFAIALITGLKAQEHQTDKEDAHRRESYSHLVIRISQDRGHAY